MEPCKRRAEEVSFEWSHHRISFTDLKVRTTLHVSITESGSGRAKYCYERASDHIQANHSLLFRTKLPGRGPCWSRF